MDMNFRVEDYSNTRIDLNKVTLHGQIQNSINLHYTESGEPVAKFCILVIGHVTEDTLDNKNYFNIVVWGKLAEKCKQDFNTHDRISIIGRLQWRTWESIDRSCEQAVEVIAEKIKKLDK